MRSDHYKKRKKVKIKKLKKKRKRKEERKRKKIKKKNKKKTLNPSVIPKGDHRKLNISSEKWKFLLINFFQYRVEFLLNGQQLKQWLEGWNTQRKVMCRFSLRVVQHYPSPAKVKRRRGKVNANLTLIVFREVTLLQKNV